jgi:hypothetical protein
MLELVKNSNGFYYMHKDDVRVGHLIVHQGGLYTGRKYDYPEITGDNRGPMVQADNMLDCYNQLCGLFR